MKLIAYDDIKKNEEVRAYIQKSDAVLGLMGYAENHHFILNFIKCQQ